MALTRRGPLTVRELVEDAGFEIELVAGVKGADRDCRAVYVGEHLDPIPWMARASLQLMAGLALRDAGADSAGPRLIRLLHDGGMAGLGISLPHYLSKIPASMIAEADRLQLPLLAITGETLFRDIERYVFDALTSAEMQRLRRIVSIQHQLLELSAGEHAVADVVQRLADLLNADVVLFGGDREVVLRAARPIIDRRRQRLSISSLRHAGLDRASWEPPRRPVRAGRWLVSSRDIRVRGLLRWTLVTAHRSEETDDEYVEAALAYAQRLLEIDLVRRDRGRSERMATGAALLAALLKPSEPPPELVERLTAVGLGPEEPYRIALLEPAVPCERRAGDGGADEPSRAAGGADERSPADVEHVWSELRDRGEDALCRWSAGRLVLMTTVRGARRQESACEQDGAREQGAARRRAARELIAAAVPAGGEGAATWRVGASEEHVGADGVAAAHRQAVAALGAANVTDPAHIVLYEDLGLGLRCLDALSSEQLERVRDRLLAPLRSLPSRGDALLDTVRVYVRRDASLSLVAGDLRVHRNTVRQRLALVEGLLGVDLASLEGRLEIYLAVQADHLLEARRAGDGVGS
jgi:purine catabolism regulator